MRSPTVRPSALIVSLALLVPLLIAAGTSASAPTPDPLSQLRFVENQGQVAKEIAFYAPLRNGQFAITRQEHLRYLLTDGKKRLAIEERLLGARTTPLQARHDAVTRVSYFQGGKKLTGLPSHQSVVLEQPWPGVSLELVAREGTVEKIFRLAPHTPVDTLRLQVSGAQALALESDGRLRLTTALGAIHLSAPEAYQLGPGDQRQVIQVAYRLDHRTYGFTLGAHDPNREVVIDPLLGTALLHAPSTSVRAMTVDAEGHVFVVGKSWDTALDTLAVGTYDDTNDAWSTSEHPGYVAKFSRDLTQLLALTFINGTPGSYIDTTLTSVVATETGAIMVAGYSNASDFPVVGPAKEFNSQYFGGNFAKNDFVIARFDNDLTSLTHSAYLGGSGDEGYTLWTQGDEGYDNVDLALAADGQSIYLVGNTVSGDLPTNQGSGGDNNQPAYEAVNPHPVSGYLSSLNMDCYLAQLPLDLTTVNATWVGNTTEGNWGARCTQVATDPVGSVFVAGNGYGQFESGVSGQQTSQSADAGNLSGDAFIARFTADLHTLPNATFLGGTGGLSGVTDLVVPDNGDVVVVGKTASSAFPVTSGAITSQFDGGAYSAGFAARFNNSLVLQAATYVHSCPSNGTGGVDCSQGGSGSAVAVDVYNYDQGNSSLYDIYLLFNNLTAGVPLTFTGAYLSPPTPVAGLTLLRLDQALATKKIATALQFQKSVDYDSRPALTISEEYFDGSQNQSDPRVFAAFQADAGLILHPAGFTGPDQNEQGNPFPSNSGVYVTSLDPSLASGTTPAIDFTATGIDFGHLPPNYTSMTKFLTVSNSGSQTITFLAGAFTANSNDAGFGFASAGTCLSSANSYNFPFTLNPGSSCQLAILLNNYGTADPFAYQGHVELVTNDPNGAMAISPALLAQTTPLFLTFAGSNYLVGLDYNETGLNLGAVSVGQTADKTVTVKALTDGVAFGTLQVSGDDVGQFQIESDSCSNQTFNNGQTCQLTMRYQPSAAGTHDSWLLFAAASGGGSLLELRLHGAATGPVAPLNVSTGWNLLSSRTTIDTATAFSDGTSFASIWKWAGTSWAVTLPGESDSGQAYAVAKGFTLLTTIDPGDGFWVNALKAATITPAGTPTDAALSLASGWNLVGLRQDASVPAATLVSGKESQLLSLWKWAGNTWAVTLPPETDAGAAYATSKGFTLLDTINPGEGFWVNTTGSVTLP